MTKTMCIVLFATLATAAGAQGDTQLQANDQVRSVKAALPSVEEVVGSAEVLSGLYARFRARRTAVLTLWVKGEQIHHIAALTGYTIPNVRQTIEKFEVDIKEHLVLPDSPPAPCFEVREVDAVDRRPAHTQVYLKGGGAYGRVTKVDTGIWSTYVPGNAPDSGSSTSYWFSKEDAIEAAKTILRNRPGRLTLDN